MKRLIPVILILITLCACEKEQIIEGESDSLSTFEIVTYLNDKARELSNNDPEKAIEIANEALLLATKEAYLQGQKQSHNTLYFIYLNELKNLEKAKYHSNAFASLTNEVEKAKDLIYANYKQGMMHYQNGDLSKSMPFLFEAYDLSSRNNEDEKAAYSLYALAKIFEKTGKYEEGIFYLNKASENLDENFLWTVHHLKGSLLFEIGDYQNSLKSYEKAKDIVFNLDLPSKKIKVLDDLALTSIRLGEIQAANTYIEKGLQLSKDNSLDFWTAKLLSKKAFALEKSNLEESIQYYEKAYGIFKLVENEELASEMILNISRVLFSQGKIEESNNQLIKISEGIENLTSSLQKEVFLHKVKIAKSLNNTAEKFEALYEVEKIENTNLKNSEFAAVSKAELAYKEKITLAKYNTYIEDVRKEIAEDERRGTYYLMGFGFMCACVLLLLAIRRPAQFFMNSAERVMLLMEDLQATFKKRLAGEGAPLPEMQPLKKPEPPDERDIHNLWTKDRHGRKGDKDKGKDDPAPGLDDE